MFNTVRQKSGGFTIVELLIVIVVIGILAAIVIVAFNGVQERAKVATVQSDLRSFNTVMQAYRAEFGSFPTVPTASMGIKFTKNIYGVDGQGRNARYCRTPAADEYVLMVNTTSEKYYIISSRNSSMEEVPSTYGYGVCAHLGLSSTNPQADGYSGGATGSWAAWVN